MIMIHKKKGGYTSYPTRITPLLCLSLNRHLLSVLCLAKWEPKKWRRFFTRIEKKKKKSHFITLTAETSLCSPSHKLFPCRFRRRLRNLASEPKDRGRWGGGRGQQRTDGKKGDTGREGWMEEEGMGKGGQVAGKNARQRANYREWCQSRERQCVCEPRRLIMKRARDKTTAPHCPSDRL